MSQRALEKTEAIHHYAVSFIVGDRDDPFAVYRFTNYSEARDFLGETYASVPEMDVELPWNTFEIGDNDPLQIMLPRSGFTLAYSQGEPTALTHVVVREVIGDVQGQDVIGDVVFDGTLGNVTVNPNEQEGLVLFEAWSIKDDLDVEIGIRLLGGCSDRFAQPDTCGVDTTLLRQSLEVVEIDGATITVTGLNPATQWVNGWVTLGGVTIKIRDAGSEALVLFRQPPLRWAGSTVIVHPGCRKTPADCSSYGNLSRGWFGGIAIPARQPLTEEE